MISVGIERNVPIRSSATAIEQIYAYISIQIRSTIARCQLIVFRVIGSLVTILSFQPLDFEARIEMVDSRRKWLKGKRCAICILVDMTVHRYQPN